MAPSYYPDYADIQFQLCFTIVSITMNDNSLKLNCCVPIWVDGPEILYTKSS